MRMPIPAQSNLARSSQRFVCSLGYSIGLALVGLAFVNTGCDSIDQINKPLARPGGTLEDEEQQAIQAAAQAAEGTIGATCYVQGIRKMRVQGFGVVIGLPGTGNEFVRESLREHLERQIRHARSVDGPHQDQIKGFTATELLEHPDTAVVVVEGEIPAGAPPGRRFDVTLRAADEDVQSVAGGFLLPTELKIFKVSPQEVLEGRTRASAMGPVFINPFRSTTEEAASATEGRVINGGVNKLGRKLSLVVPIQSYQTVRRIRDTINRRFGLRGEKIADATSPSNVDLRIPERYAGKEGRFLDMVLHLPLTTSQVELEQRTQDLIAQMSDPNAPFEEVTLSLEGIGVSVLEPLRSLYSSPDRIVSFYAGRTGLRLEDDLAVEVLTTHAKDPQSPFRYQAIEELGQMDSSPMTNVALSELLGDSDARVRVLAYESLRQTGRSRIARFVIGTKKQNFILEIVPCEGKPMIYATRTQAPRIALIGGDRMYCTPPFLYSGSEKPVTITAGAEDKMVRVLRKHPDGTFGPYHVSPEVPVLAKFLGENLTLTEEGAVAGLGLNYDEVVEVLYRLCEKNAINADMRWEEPSVEEMVGPMTPLARPESEL